MRSIAILLTGLLFVCLSPGALRAQDIHYTQFYNSPLVLSPGLTGVFGGNTRLMGNYRSQWSSVPVGYQTFTAGVDHNFFGKGFHPGYFAGGLVFHYDRAGDSRLSMLNLNLNGAYTRRLSSNFYATLGVQLGAVQRSFDQADLMFDEQYDGYQVDPNIDPTDPLLQFENNNQFFDFSAGLNLRWQKLSDAELVDRLEQRSRIDFGIGVFHLNRPNQSFVPGYDASLPIRLAPYVMATIQAGDVLDIVGTFNTQIQVPYNETLAGLGAILHLDRRLGRQIALQLGMLFRFQEIADAYSPNISLYYNKWRVGFSYDVNISEFNVATQRRSGPEISVQYIIKGVKLPTQKICPII